MASGTQTQTAPSDQAPFPKQKEGRGWLWSLLIGLAILGLIATIPWIGDASDLHTWTLIIMFAVLAQGWNFIGGFTGYSAFGNVAFFGIGAYTTGLMLLANQPFWLGLIAGALVAGLFAFLLGLPVLMTVFLTRSRFGYALIALRESEQAAEALGVPTYWYKVGAFVLSAVPTALAGGLYAYWATGFDPDTVFNVGITVEMVLLTFLGGAGTVLGPLLGAIAFEYRYNVSFQLQTSGFSLHNTLLGLSIAIVTIFLPQGIVRLVQEFVRRPAPGPTRANRLLEGVRRVRRFIAANGI